jgi:hypothetical protein
MTKRRGPALAANVRPCCRSSGTRKRKHVIAAHKTMEAAYWQRIEWEIIGLDDPTIAISRNWRRT